MIFDCDSTTSLLTSGSFSVSRSFPLALVCPVTQFVELPSFSAFLFGTIFEEIQLQSPSNTNEKTSSNTVHSVGNFLLAGVEQFNTHTLLLWFLETVARSPDRPQRTFVPFQSNSKREKKTSVVQVQLSPFILTNEIILFYYRILREHYANLFSCSSQVRRRRERSPF